MTTKKQPDPITALRTLARHAGSVEKFARDFQYDRPATTNRPSRATINLWLSKGRVPDPHAAARLVELASALPGEPQ